MSDPVDPRAQRYADERTTPFSGATAAAAGWTASNTPWPGMMAGLAEARLLEALIVAGGARRVLEIGTFTGVGALSMAAAVGPGGRVITLELDDGRAADARRHIEASPYAERIELIVGDALASIARLEGPFDLVWIDAWKADYVAYWEAVTPKLSERGVVVADNLFRDGAAFSDGARDRGTLGIREFADRVQADERFDNVLLTVGDGVMLAWRRPDAA
jgi:predicted O-methyltransferase YrrM